MSFQNVKKAISLLSSHYFSLSLVSNLRGFCYFNSVAIAAKLLQQRLNVSKILIVDWVSSTYNTVDCLLHNYLFGE